MQKLMKLSISLLSFIILLGCSGESISNEKDSSQAMNETANKESKMLGIFGKDKGEAFTVSSPLEGRLVRNGKPLTNTKIIRRLRWNGNDDGVIDEFMTDERGYFSIPAREELLTLGKLTQFVSNIELFAESETDDNFFWYSNKFSGEVYSDFEAPIQELVCDINEKENRVELSHGAVFSKCQWRKT